MSSEQDIKELQKKVEDLTELVHRQSKIIQQTGQQLLELQIKLTESDFKKLDQDDKVSITEEDLAQFTGELQGQLDLIELRGVRRVLNSLKTKGTDLLAPLPNSEGEHFEDLPKTLEEFEKMDPELTLEICKFHDLISPTEEIQLELLKLLQEDNPEEGALKLKGLLGGEDVDAREFSENEVNELYNQLSVYYGLKFRRTSSSW